MWTVWWPGGGDTMLATPTHSSQVEQPLASNYSQQLKLETADSLHVFSMGEWLLWITLG
jgi:hypothetical protein